RDFHVTGVQTCALPIFPIHGIRLSSVPAHSGKWRSYPPIAGNGGHLAARRRDHVRMRHRTELPPQLGSSFAIKTATEAGVSRWQIGRASCREGVWVWAR